MLGSYTKIIKALGGRTSVPGYAPAPVQELILLIPLPHLPLLVQTALTQTLHALLPPRWGQNVCFSDAPQRVSIAVMSLGFLWPIGGRADSRKIPVVPRQQNLWLPAVNGDG